MASAAHLCALMMYRPQNVPMNTIRQVPSPFLLISTIFPGRQRRHHSQRKKYLECRIQRHASKVGNPPKRNRYQQCGNLRTPSAYRHFGASDLYREDQSVSLEASFSFHLIGPQTIGTEPDRQSAPTCLRSLQSQTAAKRTSLTTSVLALAGYPAIFPGAWEPSATILHTLLPRRAQRLRHVFLYH